jgi:hypothetical protein
MGRLLPARRKLGKNFDSSIPRYKALLQTLKLPKQRRRDMRGSSRSSMTQGLFSDVEARRCLYSKPAAAHTLLLIFN